LLRNNRSEDTPPNTSYTTFDYISHIYLINLLKKEHILILEPTKYSEEALKIYNSLGAVYHYNCAPNELQNKDQITIIVCRLNYYIGPQLLSEFPNIRYIVSPTTGLNHINAAYCEEHHIKIISLKGETAFLDTIRSTSELTFSLMLALVRNIVPSVKSVLLKHEWNRDAFRGRELSSMTLGLLGFGRIGRHMAQYAEVFGMSVIVCDPFIDKNIFLKFNVHFCSKERLFSNADIVSIHVDYRLENKYLVTRNDFKRMGIGKYLVNTSRGELISEKDIIWALEKGVLAGAALDVLTDEQMSKDFFNKKIIDYATKHENLLITPHIGGCTKDAMTNTEIFMAKKLRSIIQNQHSKSKEEVFVQ